MTRPLVLLESPYAGNIIRNVGYARSCLRDSISRGEVPIASHLLYTQPNVLDDSDPEERSLGIRLGHAWLPHVSSVVVYIDYGISNGMAAGIRAAEAIHKPIEYRTIHPTMPQD